MTPTPGNLNVPNIVHQLNHANNPTIVFVCDPRWAVRDHLSHGPLYSLYASKKLTHRNAVIPDGFVLDEKRQVISPINGGLWDEIFIFPLYHSSPIGEIVQQFIERIMGKKCRREQPP